MSAESESSDGPSSPGWEHPVLAPGAELLGPAGPDETGNVPAGDGGADGADGDLYLVRRADGTVVRMPWLLYRVASLLDGSRDLADVADRVGALDGRVCSVEEVRLVVEQRLAPAGVVTLAVGPAEQAAARETVEREPARGSGSRPVASLVLAALVLVAATAAVTTLAFGPVRDDVVPATESATAQAPPGVTAPGGLTGPPTLVGRVVEVPDVTTAVVDVDGRPLRVEVAGLDPDGTPACAVADAQAFGRETLVGQEVTLVPDPTLPALPPDRWRAYLVLGSQLSYTDAAIGAGWAAAGEGRYRPGFEAAQADAEADGVGQFGPPCVGSS